MINPDGPATTGQKEYAAQLGITFPADITFGELSNKIDRAKSKTAPSEKSIQFARNLGIEFDAESITAPELRKLTNAEVAKQSRAALRYNPVLKVGETIMYKGNPYKIDEFNRKRWRVRLVPCYRVKGVRTVWPMIISVKDATHVDVISQAKQA